MILRLCALRFQGLDLHWPEFFRKFCRNIASFFNSLNIFLQLTKFLDVPNPECGMRARVSFAAATFVLHMILF